jgi:HEAT repeat protein
VRFLGWLLALTLVSTPASALIWPDVVEEIRAGLEAPSPVVRRTAAERIASLGSSTKANELLAKALLDSDTEVRTTAAQVAIRLRANVAAEVALKWLAERDVRLRVAACEVLRAFPSKDAVAPLGRAIGDTESPLVRAAAADALGAQQPAEAVTPLLGRLDDPSPTVRVQVVKALARLRESRAVVPLVGKAQDSAPEVRQAVARGLGDLGDARAVQALVLQLRDSVVDVKLEAIAALGRLRAESGVAALAPLTSDRSTSIRSAAVAALGHVGSKEAVRVLIGIIGQGDDATGTLERTPVRDALVATGESAIPEVAAAMEAAGAPSRAASAAWILGALRAKGEAPRIVAALRRGVLPPAAALHALAGTGSIESVPVVLEYLADPSPVVRAEAMRAAGALLVPSHPDGRAVEPLFAALRARGLSDAERATLAGLLGRTGATRAAPPLVALLGARELTLRLAAVNALGQLGPADADAPLLALLRDPGPELRLRAAIALSKTGREKALNALLGWIDGGDGIDRAAVLTALGGVMARVGTQAAVVRIRTSLEVSAGGDRDALLLALGRTPAGTPSLRALATEGDEDDRRTIASVLGAVRDAPRAEILGVLLADPEPTVRAQAAWTAALFPSEKTSAELAKLVRAPDADVAANAIAALGRLGAGRTDSAIAQALCTALSDERPIVRANAATGLALTKTQCAKARERELLASDPSPEVRIALARGLFSRQSAAAAIAECAASECNARVARACQIRPADAPTSTSPVEVFVVPYGATAPKARAAYVLELANGLLRAGSADRRGALFDPAAPDGELTLRRF